MSRPASPPLGNLIKVHGISYVRVLGKLLMALLLLIVFRTSQDTVTHLFVILLLPYLVILPLVRLSRVPKIELYENGFRAGGRSFTWNEIDGLSTTFLVEILSVGVFHVGEYRLHRGNEKVLTFTYDYAQTDKLIATITAKTATSLLPVYLQELNEKGEVHFGKISLSREEITSGGRRLRLADVGAVNLWSNQLQISKRKGARGGFGVAFVAVTAYLKNYHMLLILIDGLAEQARKLDTQTHS